MAAVGDVAMAVGPFFESLRGRQSEEAADSSELVPISDPAGLSVGIPCYLALLKVKESSTPGGWRKGGVGWKD